jgi:hypothetical protein
MSAETVKRLLLAFRNDTLHEAAAVVRDIGGKIQYAAEVEPEDAKHMTEMFEAIAKAIESLRVRP